MLTIHTLTPFHHQYPRPQAVNTAKKEQTREKPLAFHEILAKKMKEKAASR